MKKLFTFCLAMVVCVLFAGKASAQFTINYTQEGEGAIQIEALVNWVPAYYDLVGGQTTQIDGVQFNMKDLGGGDWQQAYQLIFWVISGDIQKVEIDGVENQEYLDSFRNNGRVDMFFTEQKDYVINMKVTFSGGGETPVEDPYTVNYKANIIGEGTLTATFTDADSGEEVSKELVNGDNKLNVKAVDNMFNVRFTPKAAEGYGFDFLYVQGYDTYDDVAPAIAENGYFDAQTGASFTERQVEVKFVEVADGDMAVIYEQEGEGSCAYRYASKEESEVYKEGELAEGENLFTDMYFDGYNYKIYLDPKPANGYRLSEFVVNGTTYAYDGSESFVYTTDAPGKFVEVKTVFIEAPVYSVTVANVQNGTVTVEYKVAGETEYKPLGEGETVAEGTEIRITANADPDFSIEKFVVNDTIVAEGSKESPLTNHVYEEAVTENIEVSVSFVSTKSLGEVVTEPVMMKVYATDGHLVKSCMAKSVAEAVADLENGLYIVNGKKVVVNF